MPRILVVAPNRIGDALMAQPLLARLREKRRSGLIKPNQFATEAQAPA